MTECTEKADDVKELMTDDETLNKKIYTACSKKFQGCVKEKFATMKQHFMTSKNQEGGSRKKRDTDGDDDEKQSKKKKFKEMTVRILCEALLYSYGIIRRVFIF